MTQIGHSAMRHAVPIPGSGGDRLVLSWTARSDTGYHRSVNEDSLLAAAPIFAVADGMGGHTAGDVASSAVVTRLAEQVGDFVERQSLDDALRQAVQDIGRCVGPSDLGTGTTVTGLAMTMVKDTPLWLVFNIGDSRVYQLTEGILEQLTTDHSIVQELLDSGAISRAEAEIHPHGHVITRAVGFNEEPMPDYWLIPIVSGSRLLVCSDGLTKELTEYGVRHYLSSADSTAAATDALVDAALDNGGRDNVSVIVVDVLEAPEARQ